LIEGQELGSVIKAAKKDLWPQKRASSMKSWRTGGRLFHEVEIERAERIEKRDGSGVESGRAVA
jgi:hypothetical protein